MTSVADAARNEPTRSDLGTSSRSDGKRVAFFLPDMGGGGAERVQLAVIAALLAEGHEIDLLLAFHRGALLPLVPPQVRIIDLGAKRLLDSFKGLTRYLRSERPFALQAVMWPCTSIAIAARIAARVPTKVVLSDHNALSRQYLSTKDRTLLRATMAATYPMADSVIAVSKGVATDIAMLSGRSAESIDVIYNPLNTPSTKAPDEGAMGMWDGASPRIITVGRLVPQKNHAMLIDAMHRLLQVHPAAKLVILGEGPLRDDLEQKCRDLGIEESVSLPGFLIDPWPSLQTADLFALSSDFEGFAIVIVEALQMGLRVVSTDCLAGPAELLEDGRYGRLVPVGDSAALAKAMIDELADPPQKARQQARAAEISGADNLARYVEVLTT